jgi:hypothetical protein
MENKNFSSSNISQMKPNNYKTHYNYLSSEINPMVSEELDEKFNNRLAMDSKLTQEELKSSLSDFRRNKVKLIKIL